MPTSKSSKATKSGASKGKASATKGSKEKKAGTRVGTLVYVRGEGAKKGAKKSGGSDSRKKIRDGSR
ncbi:MAG TPA: hypothetical protein VIQ24_20575 [Pyrinomonadaceae bacterium]